MAYWGYAASLEFDADDNILAGRLIRDETDRGVLMICAPRLLTKQYGRRIWQSLPPMKCTRELVEVEAFFSGRVPSVSGQDIPLP